jgi:hypothetical protein
VNVFLGASPALKFKNREKENDVGPFIECCQFAAKLAFFGCTATPMTRVSESPIDRI